MFIGNAKAIKLLNKAVENGKISHAYLFSGPESVGKFTLAEFFASAIVKGKTLKSEIEKVGFKNLPDIIILEPEIEEKKGIVKEKDIKVENIREIQQDLLLFPYEGRYKVLIINNAHKMTVSGQNSLLKTLEEPNETSVIIIVTHDDSKIISTIKSRCQKINFSLVDSNEIKEISNEEILKFSMGRPGLSFEMIKDKEKLDNKRNSLEILNRFSELGVNERFKLAEKMSLNPSETIKKMEFWTWIVRSKLLENRNLKDFQIIEKIEKASETIKNTNANTKLVLENLFLEI